MKTINLFKSMVLLCVIAMTTQSCLKEEFKEAKDDTDVVVEKEDKLSFSDEFEWKTSQEFEISVLPNANAIVYVKSADNKVYHKQFLQSGHEVSLAVTVPTYEKELVIELAGQRQKLDLSTGEYSVTNN